MKVRHLFISFILGLGLAAALLWCLGDLSKAAPRTELRVCFGGCNYSHVQDAVDAAHDGDVIKVAVGTYTGVISQSGVAQVVYISKAVTIQGGYTITDWTTPDPVANPTTLDAQGQGRVLSIIGSTSATIKGLYLTGGDAAGLDGGGFCEGGCPTDAGGGVYVAFSNITLEQNRIFGNNGELGGGLYVRAAKSVIRDNVFTDNTASNGGGVFLRAVRWDDPMTVTLQGNIVTSNTASGSGGGIMVAGFDGFGTMEASPAPVLLEDNVVANNSAAYGGGLTIDFSAPTSTNNIVVDNQASVGGSGVYVWGGVPQLLHTTIAHNGGESGSGICVDSVYPWPWDDRTMALTNTILVSHTVGISVSAGSAVTLDGTFWGSKNWANDTDWAGAGAIATGTVNIWGNPAFVDPDAGDYHIGPGSAAIDAGVNAGVATDVDGESRPSGAGYDIGADEFISYKIYLPLVVRNYGLCETHTATLTLSATATTLRVNDTVTVTARLVNQGCVALGIPQYWLLIRSDQIDPIFDPDSPEPVEHYLAVAPGQSDTVDFVLQAIAPGQATLNSSVSFEVHLGYPGPAYWGSAVAVPLVINVTP